MLAAAEVDTEEEAGMGAAATWVAVELAWVAAAEVAWEDFRGAAWAASQEEGWHAAEDSLLPPRAVVLGSPVGVRRVSQIATLGPQAAWARAE